LDIKGEKNCDQLKDLPETPDLGVIMLPPKASIQQSEMYACTSWHASEKKLLRPDV
jgi:hypothetical protein